METKPKTTKKNPLDGYDYTADVPRGTPLLVCDHHGQAWRLARRGVRYHSDVTTLLHGARQARAPKEVAASDRIRAIADATYGRGELPAGIGQPIARWIDAPRVAGSMAATPIVEVYADRWIRAVAPVYDDAARVGARQLSAREWAALERDLAVAPRGHRLHAVSVRERSVRIAEDDPRAALASTVPGAREAYPGGPWYVPVTAWRAAQAQTEVSQ